MHSPMIAHHPNVMGGKPCIRGMRVTVGTILGMPASGSSRAEVPKAYPYIEDADVDARLSHAAWRLEARDEELAPSWP
jgi:uncharacterized protein (DUF433 family)